MMSDSSRRIVAAVTAAALLAGCVSTRQARIGGNDGMDSCRGQLVALDSTGDFFAEDILKGAAIGAVGGAALGAAIGGNWRGALIGAAAGAATGAAGGYLAALQSRSRDQAQLNASLASDLSRENAQLDRTQAAFNQLMDCRFNRAQQVREAFRLNRLPKDVAEAQMAALRARTGRDIELARSVDQRIGARGAEFDTATETVSPGVKTATLAAKAQAPIVAAQPRAPVVLRLRPDPGAPEIGRLSARQAVQLRPAAPGYAQVQTPSGQQVGYADTGAFTTAGARGAAVPVRLAAVPSGLAVSGASDDVRSLAASNIARRENFTDTVATAERAAGGGFELAS